MFPGADACSGRAIVPAGRAEQVNLKEFKGLTKEIGIPDANVRSRPHCNSIKKAVAVRKPLRVLPAAAVPSGIPPWPPRLVQA